MSQSTSGNRRDFLKTTAAATAAATVANSFIARTAHAGNGDDTIKIALIGCGGRGSGAASQALSTEQGPVKLIAMADAFEDRLKSSHANLQREHADKVDVKPENMFVGFDAYQKAIDSGTT